jgi:heavy metal sensor kinase
MKARFGLRIRLAFAYMCWSVVLANLVGFLSYYVLVERLESQLDRKISAFAADLVRSLPTNPVEIAQLPYVAKASGNTAGYPFEIRNANGILLTRSFNPLLSNVAPESPQEASGPAAWQTAPLPDNRRVRIYNVPFADNEGNQYVVRVAAPLANVDEVRDQFAWVLIWLVPFVAVAGAASAWMVLRQALMPVRNISQAAQRITASNLPTALPLRGTGDELDQVAAAFNAIIAEMHIGSKRMWQYLSNISHELRTPLAALRAETEVALRWARTEQEYRQVLTSNIEELDRITKTVADMLQLARAEAGQVEFTRKPENLSEIAHTAIGAMEALAAQHGITFQTFASEDVVADVSSDQVLRLLLILLDNAIKYSYASGVVRVTVKQRGEWALISVADKGRGIAAEDLPHIFERFYRSQAGRTREVEGSGLGLSHADWIVRTHGGRIDVESKVGRGTRFNVWLPLRPVPEPATIAQNH